VRPDVLGMLRILTNFEMDSKLVLSLVLAGQPPLGALLRHDRLEDVAQRLNFCVTLRLLSREETARYIEHRCAVAGAPTCPFAPEAFEAIFESGRGNLRATDRLARGAAEGGAQRGLRQKNLMSAMFTSLGWRLYRVRTAEGGAQRGLRQKNLMSAMFTSLGWRLYRVRTRRRRGAAGTSPKESYVSNVHIPGMAFVPRTDLARARTAPRPPRQCQRRVCLRGPRE
jgi:hypothetical protein